MCHPAGRGRRPCAAAEESTHGAWSRASCPRGVTRWMSTGEKSKTSPGPVAADLRRHAEPQPLLHDGALGRRRPPPTRGRGREAGVVARHPADEPDLDLVVEAQALEDALGGVVADEVAPPPVGSPAQARRRSRAAPRARGRRGRSSEKPRRVGPQQRLVVLRDRAAQRARRSRAVRPRRSAHERDSLWAVGRGLVEELGRGRGGGGGGGGESGGGEGGAGRQARAS